MKPGFVKFYNDERGFGYIKPEGEGMEIYIHATALHRAGMNMLREGQKVSFDTHTDHRSGKTIVDKIKLL